MVKLEKQASNFNLLNMGGWNIWFSYETPIAFEQITIMDGCKRINVIVRENDWGPTTGKHLNQIDGGGRHVAFRLPGDEFEKLLSESLSKSTS
jgi:hypothetical protein